MWHIKPQRDTGRKRGNGKWGESRWKAENQIYIEIRKLYFLFFVCIKSVRTDGLWSVVRWPGLRIFSTCGENRKQKTSSYVCVVRSNSQRYWNLFIKFIFDFNRIQLARVLRLTTPRSNEFSFNWFPLNWKLAYIYRFHRRWRTPILHFIFAHMLIEMTGERTNIYVIVLFSSLRTECIAYRPRD